MKGDALIENGMLGEPDLPFTYEEKPACVICGVPCNSLFCAECRDTRMTVEVAMSYGKDRPDFMELNGFFVHVFSQEEINVFLAEKLADAFKKNPDRFKTEARRYCMDDSCDFCDWCEEKVEV